MLETLSATELGAFYRLARLAWGMGCTLPDDEAFLAAVARITPEEFATMRRRLLLTLAATQAAPGENFVLEVSRRVQDSTLAAADRRRNQTAAATEAAARAKRARSTTVDDPSRIRHGSVTDPLRIAAPPLRSQSFQPSAHPLERSNSERAIPSAPDQDVIAQLGAGARAQLSDAVATWRRSKALGMLQDAIAKWRAAGVTDCPLSKASELAGGEHADPARVDYLIEEAGGMIARAKAAGGTCNPVGFLIAGLGASQARRGRPAEVPMFVAERWARRQADSLRLLEAEAAIRARMVAARDVVSRGGVATSG